MRRDEREMLCERDFLCYSWGQWATTHHTMERRGDVCDLQHDIRGFRINTTLENINQIHQFFHTRVEIT